MKIKLLSVLALFALLFTHVGSAQEADEPKLKFIRGPVLAKLGGIAEIQLPENFGFLDGENTRKMLEAAGDPVSGNELGYLRPTNGGWSVYFEFSDSGYIKDAEKEKLDADALLKSIKRGTEAQNKHREAAGNAAITVVGWEQPPKYNPETHNLEWAVRARSQGQDFLNYNTRLLGRKGVMEVVLVCDAEDLPATLPDFKKLLTGYRFQEGESYAEFRSGDKVAQYGLAALVVGGAAVGAAKVGLFGWLLLALKKGFKLVIIAVVAVAAGIKKLFEMISGRKNKD